MIKKKTRTIIYILRHGESESNAKRSRGEENYSSVIQAGSALTKKGKQQAKNIAKYLGNVRFDIVFSSDLTRAQKTAEIILENRIVGKDILHTSSQLRERSWGSLKGKVTTQVLTRISMIQRNMATDIDKMRIKIISDMESEEQAVLRFCKFINDHATIFFNKTILIVSHGNIMRSLLVTLGYASYHELPPGSVKNTGIVVLNMDTVSKKLSILETKGIERANQ